MRRNLTISVLLGALFGFFVWGGLHAEPVPVTLRVALYPYVPGPHSVFTLLTQEFQKRNPGVTLELAEVDPDKEYYSGGLTSLNADVYEIDSILLSEMLSKIAPLTVSLDGFTQEAKDAVTRNGAIYAVPHWLCGNFLFYRKDDAPIRDAATWSDLLKLFQHRNKALIFDFYGRLTLGEWYITLLADRLGVEQAQQSILASDKPDDTVVSDLRQILAACPTGYCRSPAFHDKTGFYARAFIRGEASAYIGYSESLHYGLQEIMDNCGLGSACLSAEDIAVRRLPSITGNVGGGIGWVDGLAMSKDVTGTKRDMARKFIEFATSVDGYNSVLQPIYGEAPRYLLAARAGVTPPEAPLYPELIKAHAGRQTGTKQGLNAGLQALSKNLNCRLPIDRTDSGGLSKCKAP